MPREDDMVAQGGGVFWYFYTYVGSGNFSGFKISNINFLGFSEKISFFLGGGGYEDFVDIFLESSQNWTIFRGHFYAF